MSMGMINWPDRPQRATYKTTSEIEEFFQAIYGHMATAVATMLEKNPALANCRNRNGNPPLIMAIAKSDIEICRLLCEKGADSFAEGDEGLPARQFAAMTGEHEIRELIREYEDK